MCFCTFEILHFFPSFRALCNIIISRFFFFKYANIGKHYAAEDVATAREALLDRRSALLDKSQQRKILLQDSFNYHQFDRDCDETKGWINEKLKVATDDSYLDPTNLNGKVQKHQSFEVELDANKKR